MDLKSSEDAGNETNRYKQAALTTTQQSVGTDEMQARDAPKE